MELEIVGVVPVHPVRSLDATEFEIFTGPLNVVVNHIDQDTATEETLLL